MQAKQRVSGGPARSTGWSNPSTSQEVPAIYLAQDARKGESGRKIKQNQGNVGLSDRSLSGSKCVCHGGSKAADNRAYNSEIREMSGDNQAQGWTHETTPSIHKLVFFRRATGGIGNDRGARDP